VLLFTTTLVRFSTRKENNILCGRYKISSWHNEKEEEREREREKVRERE
jgi:hypothetical protein